MISSLSDGHGCGQQANKHNWSRQSRSGGPFQFPNRCYSKSVWVLKCVEPIGVPYINHIFTILINLCWNSSNKKRNESFGFIATSFMCSVASSHFSDGLMYPHSAGTLAMPGWKSPAAQDSRWFWLPHSQRPHSHVYLVSSPQYLLRKNWLWMLVTFRWHQWCPPDISRS